MRISSGSRVQIGRAPFPSCRSSFTRSSSSEEWGSLASGQESSSLHSLSQAGEVPERGRITTLLLPFPYARRTLVRSMDGM